MNNDSCMDVINIFSLYLGLQNLKANEEQMKELQEHLEKQDEQYEKIIKLLEEGR